MKILNNEQMKGDSYNTPEWLRDIFENWYDPCSISNGELREFDGLGSWKDKTFINPPYSNPLPWVQNAIKENKKNKTIALLLKLDCSTKWFLLLKEANAHILLFNERIKFNGKTPNFPSFLAILEKRGLKEINCQINIQDSNKNINTN